MATKKVVRKAYKSKPEYKTIKIREEIISSVILTTKKLQNKLKKFKLPDSMYKASTSEEIIDRLQKYRSIKVPKWVYDNMVLFRNDLIKSGYDNWLPQIKKAMRHRINPATGKLVGYRFITMGDIVNLTFVQLRIELNKGSNSRLMDEIDKYYK